MNRPEIQISRSKDRLRLWLRLLGASRRIEGHLRDRLRTEFNTTLPRFDVLAALSRHDDGLKMSVLSGVLRVSNGNVTGVVDRLENDGLVERAAIPNDRRAVLVRLTPHGRAEFELQAEQHETWVNEILSDLSADQARSMAEKLAVLADEKDEEETANARKH